MFTRRASWILVGMMGLLIGVVRGDHRYNCDCLVRLTGELRQHGRELGAEFRGSYRSTPQYGELQASAREIVSRAGRLQSLARAGADYDEMQCDVQSISLAYRQLVQTVRAADASYGVGYPGPAWRYGNVSSRNPGVQRLLACMDNSIRQIHEEMAKLHVPRNGRGNDYRQHQHAPTHHGPSGFTFGDPGNYERSGFSISNGRLTLQFGR